MNTSKHFPKHYILTYSYRDLSRSMNHIVIQTKEKLSLWIQKSKQRRHLARMTDQQLLDLGITREEANKEASLAFWK